jgi:hypothetical protein
MVCRLPQLAHVEQLCDVCITTKHLSDPGTRDCPHGTLLLGYGMTYGPRPTSIIITRNIVGLLVQ